MPATAPNPTDQHPAPAFLPALDGLRAAAAFGVLLTHVAFQTGATSEPLFGRVLGRFDLAVAVFFGLSGFLLWRPHAAAARGAAAAPTTVRYLLHRAARILPAYWTVVFAAMLLVPHAGTGLRVWLANLGLVQVFAPLTLTEGLTQMWSLSVEVAFYLLLPVCAVALRRLRGPRASRRIPVIATAALLSFGWGFIPVPTPDAIHSDNWLPGYLPWFAVGMLLAEAVCDPPPALVRLARRRMLMATVGIGALLLAATDLAGPPGLSHPHPWQYALKIGFGATIAFALLAPPVLDGRAHPWLAAPPARALGRWSYGVFLWHLVVLSMVFPVFGVLPFSGSFGFVLVVTVVLTVPVAAASFALVEEPVRRAVRDRERSRGARGNASHGSAAAPTATTAISAGS
nr:acyltransferase [Skermania piniformis]